MPSVRNSKQRTAVYEELHSRRDHPTAEEIYLSLKKTNPSISLATVYRNLKQLIEDGKVISVQGPREEHYDAFVHQHYHFVCSKCGRVYDFEIPAISEIDKLAKEYENGDVTSYTLLFNGVCNSCK